MSTKHLLVTRCRRIVVLACLVAAPPATGDDATIVANTTAVQETITQHKHTSSNRVTPYLLYHPAASVQQQTRSLLIFLYGAGGSIKNYNLKRPPYARLRQELANRGYYILVPELGPLHFMNDVAQESLDAVVADVLKHNNIPPGRVHVMGTSMGGGSSLAYAIRRPDLIRSVCAVMPMTDFGLWVNEKPHYLQPVARAFGGTQDEFPDFYRRNSAVFNVSAFRDIPVLLIHGTADRIVRYSQSERLAKLLQDNGSQCRLITVDNMTHKDEVMQDCQLEAVRFFDAATLESSETSTDQWPQFRGPLGNGHATTGTLPLEWDEDTNVRWKVKIHDRGWSSPVVWGRQVWVTTATVEGHELFAVCVDRDTGEIIHDVHVFDVETPQPIATENTYASPTPVIDEQHVYVHYGTYGTACLDRGTGQILWTRRDLKCDHENGAGPNSSPFLVDNLLVVNVDGRDVQYVIAIDKLTGKTVWKTDRSLDYSDVPIHKRKAFTMPILVADDNGRQLVSPGGQATYAYDPLTGSELWRIRHGGFSIAPRPVSGHGLIFFVTDHDHPQLWASRTDGTGDVTDSHVEWKATQGMPSRSSPLLVGELLFLINRGGIVSCLEAETGDIIWKKRLDGKYSASPIFTDGRIIFLNETGTATIIKPVEQLEILAVNELDDELLMASPAIAGNSLFIRNETHLYRIGESSN